MCRAKTPKIQKVEPKEIPAPAPAPAPPPEAPSVRDDSPENAAKKANVARTGTRGLRIDLNVGTRERGSGLNIPQA